MWKGGGVRGGLPQEGKWWGEGGVNGAPFQRGLAACLQTYTTVRTRA